MNPVRFDDIPGSRSTMRGFASGTGPELELVEIEHEGGFRETVWRPIEAAPAPESPPPEADNAD